MDDASVIAFLKENPGFLNAYPDLMAELDPPGKNQGRDVHDFQEAMILKLRSKVEETSDVARELIDTSRDNLNSQARIHECVLRLLSATSFEQLIQFLQTDIAIILDMDVLSLGVENTRSEEFPMHSVTWIPPGTVDRSIGAQRNLLLQSHNAGDSDIFGSAAGLVKSAALVRLNISSTSPPALLAFGHRDADKFHSGQATELIRFFCDVLGQLIRIWLGLPE